MKRSGKISPRNRDLIARYDRRIPRYTSYPTATHFRPNVDAAAYSDWLDAIPQAEPLSLYLHVPFCAELCFYCGCHTTAVRRYPPVAAYVDLIEREIDLVGRHLGKIHSVVHIHWGGGTPTILSPRDLLRITSAIRTRFDLRQGAEIAIEVDPRTLTFDRVEALAAMGVNRASLGVQDFDETVQQAINRIQTYEETARAAQWLRDAGIGSLSLDLMYGLPHQTADSVVRSVATALHLRPDRIALFGYAHVPWMKRHQMLLPEKHLPDASERVNQALAAARVILESGYVAIGPDHFARPDDAMAVSQRRGRLRRNFQGYTTDDAATLIGFGPSSIGRLPQGYVQNASSTVAYRNAISTGRMATARGIVVTADDRFRGAIIERLMCDLTVDLEHVASIYNGNPDSLRPELARIDAMASDGIVSRIGYRVAVPDQARPFLRNVCAIFDKYLAPETALHSGAF